jgi:hypothetical protein
MFAKGEAKRNESTSKRCAAHTYFDKYCDRVTKQFELAVHQRTNSTNEEKNFLCNLSYGSLKNDTQQNRQNVCTEESFMFSFLYNISVVLVIYKCI